MRGGRKTVICEFLGTGVSSVSTVYPAYGSELEK